MRFLSDILCTQFQLVWILSVIGASNALLCTICLDRQSCANAPVTQQCTEDLVNLHHRLLWALNPNLDAVPSSDFKCYDLDMLYESPITGSSVLAVQKGCTYNTTNFCEGWIDTVVINKCATCDLEDDCNKGQAETTTAASTTVTVSTNSPSTESTSVSTVTTSSTTMSDTTVPVVNTTVTPAITTTVAPVVTTTVTPAITTTVAPVVTTTVDPAITTTVTPAITTTVTPTASTTTSATSTTLTTASSITTSTTESISTTTAKGAAAKNLGYLVNCFTLAGYALFFDIFFRP